MNNLTPFDHEGLRDWCKRINLLGGKFSIAVDFDDGNCHKLGDPNVGLTIFKNIVDNQKRSSMDWFNKDTSNSKS